MTRMRPRNLFHCDINMAHCIILCPTFPIGRWASSPVHGGNQESRSTGSLQVYIRRGAILENSARCSGDGDVFLSTLIQQSRRAGPIGCALHTPTSDLGRAARISKRPSFRNLFMKKLTRDRVVPIISASVSWLIFAIIGSGLPSLPKFASSRSRRARRFSLELNS